MWLRIAKEGHLPSNIKPHVLRHSFASYNESIIGHKAHSITSRYLHSADAALLAAADDDPGRSGALASGSPSGL